MRLQITLALIWMLYHKALALRCYQCIPGLSGTCTDTQTDCSDQCVSMTTIMNAGGHQQRRIWKTCAAAEQSKPGSLNLGLVNMTINSKSCSTDLCNSQNVTALPQQRPNGKKCYTCTEDGCSETLSCEGDEDHCISTTATVGGVQVTLKGCASRSLCAAPVSHMQVAGVTVNVSCCEGVLCNSVEGVKPSPLVLLGPPFSFVFLVGTLCCFSTLFSVIVFYISGLVEGFDPIEGLNAKRDTLMLSV